MAIKKSTKETTTIDIMELRMGRVKACILGNTPMIMHRFSQKAWHELLLPKAKANRAEREENLKHDPIGEFRGALYMNRNEREPAAIHVPAGSFQAALASAALDLPGASKSQIKRLTTVTSVQVNLFGTPRMAMHMVRSSDMARTPDVRTRPIFDEWACGVEIEFVESLIKAGQVINLLNAAGTIVGIGDWRPQKGGSFGKFKVVDENNKDYARIVKNQGRVAQLEAIRNPVAYDADTEELRAWFESEVKTREKVVPSDIHTASSARKKNGSGASRSAS